MNYTFFVSTFIYLQKFLILLRNNVMDLSYTTGMPVLPTGMPDTQPEHHQSASVTLLMICEL